MAVYNICTYIYLQHFRGTIRRLRRMIQESSVLLCFDGCINAPFGTSMPKGIHITAKCIRVFGIHFFSNFGFSWIDKISSILHHKFTLMKRPGRKYSAAFQWDLLNFQSINSFFFEILFPLSSLFLFNLFRWFSRWSSKRWWSCFA